MGMQVRLLGLIENHDHELLKIYRVGVWSVAVPNWVSAVLVAGLARCIEQNLRVRITAPGETVVEGYISIRNDPDMKRNVFVINNSPAPLADVILVEYQRSKPLNDWQVLYRS